MGILNKDKNRLALFSAGVKPNTSLPKYKIGQKEEGGKTEINNIDKVDDIFSADLPNTYTLAETNFDEIAKLGLEDLGKYLLDHPNIQKVLFGYDSYRQLRQFDTTAFGLSAEGMDTSVFGSKKKEGFFEKLNNFFKKTKEELSEEKFDVLQFFNDIKLTSREGIVYKNRIENYLIAIHQALEVGQVARIEQLFKNLIFNKYDATLVSLGYYHVITEEQVVKFAKNCSKGVSLTYIENYLGVIPNEVMKKVLELNKHYIFDNYVILHYDPAQKKEAPTEKEITKKKDPILFGVCCGCSKLYYIADWIDETCNLTLDQFVDTLGIKKDALELSSFTNDMEK